MALAHLFGFGHTQSDNIKGKKMAPAFQKNIVELLKTNDVVIADRNNHLNRHRDGIREAVSSLKPPPRLIALYWDVTNNPPATVHRIVTDRISSRGDNHQTLTPSNVANYEGVVWQFLNEFNELAEGEVDEVIEMEVDESVEDALARAVQGIVDLLDVDKPSDENMGEALRVATEYRPVAKKTVKEVQQESKKVKSALSPRYYALLPEIDLEIVVGSIMASNTPVPDSGRQFWEYLKAKSRVAQRPHITITHIKSREHEEDLWTACEQICTEKPPSFRITLGHLVWNDRVMALTAEDTSFVADSGEGTSASRFLEKLGNDVKKRLHITVGTKESSIPPVEAKALVENWRAGEGEINSVALQGFTASGRVKGLIG